MGNPLESLKGMEFNGVRELAAAAKHVLRTVGTSQEKGTVAEYPNERTVRYYITEGLLDQAIKKRGVTSVFGYEHLLTLLTIKKLQADGLPISVIKNLIADKSIEELEKLFGEEVHVFTNRDDLDEYRLAAGHTDDSEVVVMNSMALPPQDLAMMMPEPGPGEDKKSEAQAYLRSLLMEQHQRPEPPQSRRPVPAAPEPRLNRGTSDWRRYEIVPGLELHVSRRFRLPGDDGTRQRILVLIDGILNSRTRP